MKEEMGESMPGRVGGKLSCFSGIWKGLVYN